MTVGPDLRSRVAASVELVAQHGKNEVGTWRGGDLHHDALE